MKTIIIAVTTSLAFILFSCGGDIIVDDTERPVNAVEIESGMIVINEFCYKSQAENEYGSKSDWIELYNTSSEDITFYPGAWSITDNPKEYDKYYIPEVTIAAGDYLIIWCDSKDKLGLDVHTNFKLDAEGETISLFYNGELMDEQKYDSTGVDYDCKCRTEDGGEEWIYTSTPTLEKSNSILE